MDFDIDNLIFVADDFRPDIPLDKQAYFVKYRHLIPVFEGLKPLKASQDELIIMRTRFIEFYPNNLLDDKVVRVVNEIFEDAQLLRPNVRHYFLEKAKEVIVSLLAP